MVWWYRAVLPLIALAVAHAQFPPFAGLSSTDDGTSVYFASTLRLRGTDRFLWSKIFRIDANGAALVMQVAKWPGLPTNNYDLGSPQVSGDGTLLPYTGSLDCGEGSSCFLF